MKWMLFYKRKYGDLGEDGMGGKWGGVEWGGWWAHHHPTPKLVIFDDFSVRNVPYNTGNEV